MYTLQNCPLPKLDFDFITLGHGSGGLLTNKLLEAGVFSLFDNELLAEGHDGAVLNLDGPVAFTTDSFVVSPLFFPGGNIGDLAINGTVNDIAMCGGIPNYLSVGFILEEGLKMEDFWRVLVSMKNAADTSNVKIVTGDTKVVEHGKGDQIFINTTGLGTIHPNAAIHVNRIEEGDQIIVNSDIARHGTAILSVRAGLEFETTITSDTTSLIKQVTPLLDRFGGIIHLMRDATRGGVATVLTELAGQSNLGFEIYERGLPIDDEVTGACELLGLDPLFVANEGLFVMFVKGGYGNAVVNCLHEFEAGSKAAIIGEVTSAHLGKAILHHAFGNSVMKMLPGEQLPRIC